jgi:DNA-binding HxlR family transcriptional regulator
MWPWTEATLTKREEKQLRKDLKALEEAGLIVRETVRYTPVPHKFAERKRDTTRSLRASTGPSS